MNADLFVFPFAGLIFVGLGIPLALRKVGPNGKYGLRVPATFADESVWYDANAAVGRDLIVAGVIQFVAWAALAGWPGLSRHAFRRSRRSSSWSPRASRSAPGGGGRTGCSRGGAASADDREDEDGAEEADACVARETGRGVHREVRSGDRASRADHARGVAQAVSDRRRARLRQLQRARHRLRLDRTHVRRDRVAGGLRARRESVFHVRKGAARSRRPAAGRRQSGPLHSRGERGDAECACRRCAPRRRDGGRRHAAGARAADTRW